MTRIDRRGFLGLFSAAALAAIAPIDRLIRIERTRFNSPAFGFSMEIPDGWHHWTAEELKANRELLEYVEDHRCDDEVTPTPLIGFSRYKEPYPEFNPGVCIYGDRRADWMGDDLAAFADAFVEYDAGIVHNPRITRLAHEVSFHGCDSMRAALIYDVVCTTGFQHRVVDDFFVMFHAENLILFQLEQSFAGKERADKEFGLIERTLIFG